MLIDTDTDTFPVPNIFDIETGTFFGTQFFRYRFLDFFRYQYQYFFWYQIFPLPVLRLFPVPNFSDTGSETTKKYEKFPAPIPVPIKNLQTF